MTSHDSLEVLFPSSMFGCIIGEKGATISEIRNTNDVKIQNDKHKAIVKQHYRQLKIDGGWCNIWNAFCQIIKTMDQAENNNKQNSDPEQPDSGKCCIYLKIPACVAGQFIGRQGSNLKEWRDKWRNATFDVDQDDTIGPNWRYVKVRAPAFDLCEASILMADVLEAALSKHQNLPSSNATSGPGQESGRRQQNNSRNGPSSRDIPLVGDGNRDGSRDRRKRGRDSSFDDHDMKRNRRDNNRGTGTNSNSMSNNVGQGQGNGNVQSSGFGECSTQIIVHDSVIGKVIGAQGSVIKNLRSASGCAITTDKQGDRSDGLREINIRGLVPQVQVALTMVTAQVSMNN